jgi:hypothetical protein
VPAALWSRWSKLSKRVFNETYSFMRHNQTLSTHPEAPRIPLTYWRTIAWNAAVTAAQAARESAPRRGDTIAVVERTRAGLVQVGTLSVH